MQAYFVTSLIDRYKKKYPKYGPKLKVSFRISPVNQNSWSKFGTQLEDIKECIKFIEKYSYMTWKGIHFHTSRNLDSSVYEKNIQAIGSYLQENFSYSKLSGFEFLDIGGGFFPEDIGFLDEYSFQSDLYERYKSYFGVYPGKDLSSVKITVDPVQDLGERIERIKKSFSKSFSFLNREITIITETSRFLVSYSTSILMKVVSLKRGGIITDAGTNIVGNTSRFKELSFEPLLNISKFSKRFRKECVYGSLCDPSDMRGYGYFGKKACEGDILALLHQGAYRFSTAMKFIKPISRYVVMNKSKTFLGKEEETFQQRYGGCIR